MNLWGPLTTVSAASEAPLAGRGAPCFLPARLMHDAGVFTISVDDDDALEPHESVMAKVNEAVLLDQALTVLERAGVLVRREGEGAGGFCVLRGRRTLFLNTDTPLDHQMELCLEALRSLPDLESMYLPPALRARME